VGPRQDRQESVGGIAMSPAPVFGNVPRQGEHAEQPMSYSLAVDGAVGLDCH
jgi:hypothetical protein